ncbi:MAG TPA: Cof-type HAD-IIB family hydrolase [Chitinivibrionales bacterium]|nr:Cof-type HAD-IIB family hydrolase [Chitinivibrionales bacterium]
MPPSLLAFDLDGTLLTSDKRLSRANAAALADMASHGCVVALASGRLGSSMMQYLKGLPCDPALLTLNGAAVYAGRKRGSRLIYSAPLSARHADSLIEYSEGREFAVNYYFSGSLYTVRNEKTAPFNDLYYAQTGSEFHLLDSLLPMRGNSPFKIIFVGDPPVLDREEHELRLKWGGELYIVRTWEYYLEFLNPLATKGNGLAAIAEAYGVDLSNAVAFGDANNDIPMLKAAKTGIALKNASEEAKRAASYVSEWTNNEDAVAKEWERLKRS